jgi:hypothetical protein
MRLDHVSYVTSHEQLADTVQRLGSRLGSTFVDGGIHPRFGTRNFTCALKNGQYVEIVCPLDHPATETTPWGKAVQKKAAEGGGWLTWVFQTTNINLVAEKFGREPVEAHRRRPDGTELRWKQIGVKEIADSRELPFFIEWLTTEHPSQNGIASAGIESIVVADFDKLGNSWFREDLLSALGEIAIEWIDPKENYNLTGIVAIKLRTPTGLEIID